MSPRTFHTGLSRVDFLVDPSSAERNAGRQISWEDVTGEDFEDANGRKFIPHGAPVAEVAGGKIVPALAGNAADAIGLLEGPAHEDDQSAALSGYGVVTGGVVYEELVPGLVGAVKTALEDKPRGFLFETYADDRGEIPES